MQYGTLTIPDRVTALLEYVDGVYLVQLAQMRAMPYKIYLKTQHWQHFRQEALKYYQHKCRLCGDKEKMLDVHHCDYSNIGCETFNDVVVLCNDCHKGFHSKDV